MTSLEARVKEDIKAAMKGGRKDDLEVLRMLMSEVKNAAIRAGTERSGVDDEVVLKVIRKGVKSRAEAAAMYKDAGRQDLEDKETFQIGVLKRYLPAELSDAEVEVIVDTVIAEFGATDRKQMGRVMKEVMSRLGGRADGKQVSAAVGARLG